MKKLTEADLFSFLRDSLAVDTSDLTADSPLFSGGVIDSFTLVSLMTYLETTCGFRMDPLDVSLDNLDTVGRIVGYVERATAGQRV